MTERVKEKKPRAKFYLERSSNWTQFAIIFMLLSAIFRLLGVWNLWDDKFFRISQIILPLGCNLLFALFLFIFCQRGFFMTLLPVLMGVAFFIIKALGFESLLHTILCIVLYVAVALIYGITAFGIIRTKWLLPPLFAIPFVYHVLVEDLNLIRTGAMTFSYAFQETSVLCVMVSLFCVGMGLKRKKSLEEAGLPKIKDPVVIVPENQNSAENQEDTVQTTDSESTPAPEQAESSAVPQQENKSQE